MRLAQIANTRKYLTEAIRKVTFPLPSDQAKQGFVPNTYIRSLRRISKFFIAVLRLNGVNRFSNEFIQALDPKLTVDLPNGNNLTFRTGHGRLFWRARTFLKEQPMLVTWIDSFNGEDYFYDVGANVGCYSLYAAVRGIRTFAFEPEFNNLQLLYDNISLNELQEICTPIPIALGAATKLDVFYLKSISKGDALHSIGRKSYLISDSSTVTTKLDSLVMKLDDVVETFDLPQPTKLKIDVDYNELQVIKGAVRTLDHVKEVHIEIDVKLAEHREALDALEAQSFHIVRIEESLEWWNQGIANYLLAKV